MKFLLLIPAIFTLSASGQGFNKGDNLLLAYKKVVKPYYFPAPRLTHWFEGENMFLIGDKPNPNTCDYLFLALKDSILIGVFKRTAPQYFLFDASNNSILSIKSDFFLLPVWTVESKTKIVLSDNTIFSLFESLNQTHLQADDEQQDEKTLRRYQQFQTDTTLANRHIALLFDNYQTIISSSAVRGQKPPADICVLLMKDLAKECMKLYGRNPAIVWIYLGEALLNAGMLEEARSNFKLALHTYPNSIPLQVYNYRLEQDVGKQKQMLGQLKMKYKKHWMVKGL